MGLLDPLVSEVRASENLTPAQQAAKDSLQCIYQLYAGAGYQLEAISSRCHALGKTAILAEMTPEQQQIFLGTIAGIQQLWPSMTSNPFPSMPDDPDPVVPSESQPE